MQGDGLAVRVTADMELGRAATPRVPQLRSMSFPLPPAWQWRAQMQVQSIICRRSASPRPSARASSITSDRPDVVQRRDWRNTECRLQISPGRSQQAASVRAIQKVAPSSSRWPRAGLPPSGLADTMKGAKEDHSASVRNPRINADLHAGDQPCITPASRWESPFCRFVRGT